MEKVVLYVITAFIATIVPVSCKSVKNTLSLAETKEISVNGVKFNMIWVEGGTFLMGATPEQGSFVESDEKPVHQVTVDGFYMAETEVTQELWETVMGYNPSFCPNAQNPIENVSWNDCQTFIDSLNRLTGQCFRLPTEAEWEYAARGGNKSKGYKYSGSDNVDEVAWYNKECEAHELIKVFNTQRVKTKLPNELGLYDMSGNVCELCQNCYSESVLEGSNNLDDNLIECERVVRGSSWTSCSNQCRISVRDPIEQTDQFAEVGFRLAL